MTLKIADVLDTMAAAVSSLMDSAAPSDEGYACPMCTLRAAGAKEHDPDCGYRIARMQLSPADVAEIRRLARVLRYGMEPPS
jgi:hypothetical protein